MKAIWHLWAVIFASVVVPMLKAKLGIDASHVHGVHGVLAVVAAVLGVAHLRELTVGALLDRIAALEAKAGIAKLAGLFLAALTLGSMGGCANVKAMSDQQFAQFMAGQAENDVASLLAIGQLADPAKATEMKADALIVKSAIDDVIMPILTGAGAGQVTLGAINAAWPIIQAKVANVKNGGAIVTAARGIVSNLLGQVTGGALTTDVLNSRTVLAIGGVFSGTSKGIADYAGMAPK